MRRSSLLRVAIYLEVNMARKIAVGVLIVEVRLLPYVVNTRNTPFVLATML